MDDVFETLSDGDRRRVLVAVADDGPCSLDELVRASTRRDDPRRDEFRSDGTHRRARLYHVHLPKLAEAGLVEWDPDADAIRRGPAVDEVTPLLDALQDVRDASRDGLS